MPGRTLQHLVAAAGLAAALHASAGAGETPLVFQGNLFDALPEPFFPTMFRVRDLDGDGFPDLLIAGRDPDNRLMTRRGLGNGRFEAFQTLTAQGFTDWLEVADMDGDGLDDIVSAWRGDAPELVCYRGIGAGLFAEATILADVVLEGVGRDPQSVALGDFDRDGDVDVAVTNYVGQSIDVFTNRVGNGGGFAFERTARVRLASQFGGVAYPRIVTAADMDGDGDLDLVANELGGSRVALIRNQGGAFVRAREFRAPQIGNERPGVAGLEVVDVDGDGDLDAFCPALLLETTQKVVCFINDGHGDLSERLVGEGAPTGYVFSAHLADFDGDGDLDCVSGAALPGTIAIARRTGAGVFNFEIDQSTQFGQLIRHLDAVDVDGDCDLDIVGIDGPSRSVFMRRNITPQEHPCGGGVAEVGAGSGKRAPAVGAATARGPVRASLPRLDLDHDGAFTASDAAIWLHGLLRAPESAAPMREGAKSP